MPNPYYGPAFHDQPILALGKVRHVGEPVAIVLAADPHVAEEAADLIAVEYEPLEAVFDEVAAAAPGAPILHDELKPAGTFTDLKHLAGRRGTNVALDAPRSPRRRRERVRRGRSRLRAHVPHRQGDSRDVRADGDAWPSRRAHTA